MSAINSVKFWHLLRRNFRYSRWFFFCWIASVPSHHTHDSKLNHTQEYKKTNINKNRPKNIYIQLIISSWNAYRLEWRCGVGVEWNILVVSACLRAIWIRCGRTSLEYQIYYIGHARRFTYNQTYIHLYSYIMITFFLILNSKIIITIHTSF